MKTRLTEWVNSRLPGKGNSNSHGARPVHLIITMITWIRTSRLSIRNSLEDEADRVGELRLLLAPGLQAVAHLYRGASLIRNSLYRGTSLTRNSLYRGTSLIRNLYRQLERVQFVPLGLVLGK